MTDVSWLQVVVLSIVQGLTEFLPVSSSGHLAIVSEAFFGKDAGASFTAVIQIGTEIAVLIYFARDIGRILTAWFGGLFDAAKRTPPDYWLGWWVILGTIRSGSPAWCSSTTFAMTSATSGSSRPPGGVLRGDRRRRTLRQADPRYPAVHLEGQPDRGHLPGAGLIPGVSRSGVTISAGLFLGQKREAAARFGFLLAIPAVLASGLFSLPDAFHPEGAGQSATGLQLLVGTVIAFVIGYAAIAWFLRFLVRHSMYWFVGYRVIVGVTVLILLGTGVIAA